jgi:hypothetical protein
MNLSQISFEALKKAIINQVEEFSNDGEISNTLPHVPITNDLRYSECITLSKIFVRLLPLAEKKGCGMKSLEVFFVKKSHCLHSKVHPLRT